VQLVEEGAETTALKEVLLYFKDFPMAVSTHYLVGDSHALIMTTSRKQMRLDGHGAYDNRLRTAWLWNDNRILDAQQSGTVLVHH